MHKKYENLDKSRPNLGTTKIQMVDMLTSHLMGNLLLTRERARWSFENYF